MGFCASIPKHTWLKNNLNPKILCLGLTYKPDTDDLRESPALLIAKKLSNFSNCKVSVCDPLVLPELLPELEFVDLKLSNYDELLSCYDLVVCLVSHKEFKLLKNFISKSVNILDFCGLMRSENLLENSSNKEYFFWPADSKEKHL